MVWVHHLKGFEYLPSYTIGRYQGKAARVGVALMQYELQQYMEQYNITLLTPASSTVGAYGGWMQGGGFSTVLTSKLGLGADQVLGLEIVTADGRFVHADPYENEDLFFAIRGGGPSKPSLPKLLELNLNFKRRQLWHCYFRHRQSARRYANFRG
jgi:FAD/FMN-containing dehydrogenase